MRLRSGLPYPCWLWPRRNMSFRIAPFASGVLVALQAAAAHHLRCSSGFARTRAEWQGPAESMFELSTDAQRDSHRARWIPVGCVRRNSRRGAARCSTAACRAPCSSRITRGHFRRPSSAFRRCSPDRSIATIEPLQRYMRDISEKGRSSGRSGRAVIASSSVTEMHHGSESATNYFRLPRPYVSYDDVHAVHGVAACRPVVVQARAAHTAAWIHNDEAWRLQSHVRARRHEHAPAPLGQRRGRAQRVRDNG